MKKFSIAVLGLVVFFCAVSANGEAQQIPIPSIKSSSLTSDEIVRGLKDALRVGAEKAALSASSVDGFYKNQEVFIPFPNDAIKVKNTLEGIGRKKEVDEFVKSLNRAAEEAAKSAAPVFVKAIQEMSIQDALGILKGGNNAATLYLKDKTTAQLKVEFQPIVAEAIKKVNVARYWKPVITAYNKASFLSGGGKVNPNIEAYVTDQAVAGMFVLIAKEELSIRKDPSARVTDIIKSVFAKQ